MIPIVSLIFIIGLSMLVTKIASIALTHTGMSRERAKFQARSAFSGVGFTTSESELVVKHPVRRRIITTLIILGNAGIVTAVSSLILGFAGKSGHLAYLDSTVLLFVGLLLLYLAARSERLDQVLTRLISRLLDRYTPIRVQDKSRLLGLMEDYEISELAVGRDDWFRDSRIEDLALPKEGILVLGIVQKDMTYIGVPRGSYVIEEDDRLVLYGKAERLQNLVHRRRSYEGKASHRSGVKAHEEEMEEQDEALEKKGRDVGSEK
jgi:hypothetical protein